ncbi:MAG TPA: PDZ domain-containing protein [Chthoniobacterales bacterium]
MKKSLIPICVAAASVAWQNPLVFAQQAPDAPGAPSQSGTAPGAGTAAAPEKPNDTGKHGQGSPRFARKTEPRTFLGIETSPIPPVVAAQLGIPEGFGLVVDFVVPDSPAAAAKIERYDILIRIEDQRLVNPMQLASLVRSFSDGKDVVLTVLRKGQEIKVTAKLARKELPTGFDPDWRHEFRRFPGMHSGEWPGLHRMRDAMRKGGEVNARFNDGRWLSKIDMGDLHVVSKDEEGTLEIRSNDGKRTLIATKPDGSVLFNGPIDTEEQKKSIPTGVLERLKDMENERLPEPPPPPRDEPVPPPPVETTSTEFVSPGAA